MYKYHVRLTQAILQNNDEKQAALDLVSSRQLKQHDERFKAQTNLPMKSVIDQKRHFEKQIDELSFTKYQPQKTPEYIKELER